MGRATQASDCSSSSSRRVGFGGPRVLLCFKPRNNMQVSEYLDAAFPFGLEQVPTEVWPPELVGAEERMGLGQDGVKILLLQWKGAP